MERPSTVAGTSFVHGGAWLILTQVAKPFGDRLGGHGKVLGGLIRGRRKAWAREANTSWLW